MLLITVGRMPRFLKIKELLENKAIGDVRFVSTIQYQKASEDVNGSHKIFRGEFNLN